MELIDFFLGGISTSSITDPATNLTIDSTDTAVSGTALLENYRLADLSGNNTYRSLVDRAEAHLINPYPEPQYPYLVASTLNVDTGEYVYKDYGWVGGIDSFYEVRPM